MADSSHSWVTASIVQRIINIYRVRECFYCLNFSFCKLELSFSESDNRSSRELLKAKSFWAMKAPFRKCWWYRLRPVSSMNSSILISNCASVRPSKGACISALGSWAVSGVRWGKLLRRFVAIFPKIVLDTSRRTTRRGYLCCHRQFQRCPPSDIQLVAFASCTER